MGHRMPRGLASSYSALSLTRRNTNKSGLGISIDMTGKGVLFVLFLCITASMPVLAHHRSNALAYVQRQTSNGPTIEWYDVPENGTLAFSWDGAYTGQTEEVWTHRHWVNDSDGVDCVIFRYRWSSEGEWTNKTATQIHGNETRGLYESNFTYAVWWNYETGRPETEGSGGNFYYKVWANDTMGNWNEVPEVGYMGGYMYVEPPPVAGLWSILELVFLILVIVGGIVGLAVLVVGHVKVRPARENPETAP